MADKQMMQEVWITIRLKGEMNAADDANVIAKRVLDKCEHNFTHEHPGLSFSICQPGDVIEVEEEAAIYGNG